MRRLEEYISAGGKLLRCGYTTGTCAAAATRAAAELLLGNVVVPSVEVTTPSGITAIVEIEEAELGVGWARCSVMKDAGDDADVTDGVLVYALARRVDQPGVSVEGGRGVGRVTRPGLDQPVGAAAINSVPRTMIAHEAQAAADAHGYQGGLAVEISIPAGVDLAAKTFNPRLGIEGGISVLGTSGIVRPMSEEALVATIKLELGMLRATGATDVVLVPGNYGRDYALTQLGLSETHLVSCSNYLGAAIDEAARLGFASLLLVGHLGKLVKVAGGVMNTHSRVADCRMEVLAAHAALAGASSAAVADIMDATTTDAALDVMRREGLLERAMASMTLRLGEHLARRGGDMVAEAVVFSQVHGIVGMTAGAKALCALHKDDEGRGA